MTLKSCKYLKFIYQECKDMSMPKIGTEVDENTMRRLQLYTVKVEGNMRKQGKVIERAVIEFLNTHSSDFE